ncbi:MAG: T9SS type A sorting domain-containing protein, partial [Bacteroidota bacterium]
AGKLSNDASPKITIPGGEDYVTITYSWGGNSLADAAVDKIIDTYTGSWWGVELMYSDDANPELRGGSNNPVPMDTAHIVALSLTIDDAGDGAPDEEKVLWIKDVQIGAADSPTVYEAWVGFETVDGSELEVVDGVVFSEGTITVMTVTGQVVATADGELDLSSVPAGVYVIVTPEGTAKLVK